MRNNSHDSTEGATRLHFSSFGLLALVAVAAVTMLMGLSDRAGEGSTTTPCASLKSALRSTDTPDEVARLYGFPTEVEVPEDVAVSGVWCWDHYSGHSSSEGSVDGFGLVDSDRRLWVVVATETYSTSEWVTMLNSNGFHEVTVTPYGYTTADPVSQAMDFWGVAAEFQSTGG